MSFGSVLLAGLSGMRASQTGMAIVSQNIANANTPGYVRTEVQLAPRTNLGPGAGVDVAGVRRAADRFLSTASYIAVAAHGSAAARSDLLARAQSAFGDPASDTSMFAMLDDFWSSLTELGVDPASTLRRANAVGNLDTMYAEVHRIGQSIQDLIAEADQRIADSVSDAQSLLNRISELNEQIRLNKRTNADSSAAENAQSALIDDLSRIIDVRVSPLSEGGVHVRTSGGALLVGAQAATLSYTPNTAPFSTNGVIRFNEELGTQSNLEPFLLGGELKGLLQVRDQDLAGLAEALGGFAAELADTLNQVHNENASSPAASTLVGRQTGLLGSDALNFTGTAIIGVVDAQGNLTQRLTVDFDAQTITGEDPAAVYNFAGGTIGAFASTLDAALAAANPSGSAEFTDGRLTLDAGSGGLVVQQDPNDPSARAGRGFSHFFGLNDLVSRPTPIFFQSGLEGSDPHGFNLDGQMVYQVRDSAGRFIAERTITIDATLAAPGSTWDDLIGELNANGTGLGEFGEFELDTTGRLVFTPNPAFQVQLTNDSTQRGSTGVSVSALHGLSDLSTAGRALELQVDAAISNDPSLLAVGRPDLTATLGTRIIEAGDNRGSAALVAARDTQRTFERAGVMTGQTATLAVYAARLGGEAGRLSQAAQRSAEGAEAVATASNDRRAQVEGVTLDDELLKMTTYQNAYAAAARVIQAAKEMLDVLMAIGYR
jgi:flagellar hook-associated protein 1 FlgK